MNEKKTKILYLDHAPYEGGAEVSLKELIKNLSPNDYELFLAAPQLAGYAEEAARHGATIIPFEFHWKGYKYLAPLFQDLIGLMKLIQKVQPDIIHCNTRVTNLIGGLIFLGKPFLGPGINFRVINHVRDMDSLRAWKFQLISACDTVICNSEQVKKFLVKNGIPDWKTNVIYNGVDTVLFDTVWERNKAPKTRPTIGFIGQIYPRKGLNYLIEALSMIKEKHPNILLKVIGEDPSSDHQYEREYKKMITERNLEPNVEWVGYLNYHSELPDQLALCDVFCLPSLQEPFGRVVVDAMAMRLPVVATAVGGVPEIVVEGETGFLVPPKEAGQLSEKILKLFESEEIRVKMGQQGYLRVQSLFALKEHVLSVEKVYQKLAKD